jgi:hypothetical protein
MSTTLRIASIVSILCVIFAAFLAFGLAYNGDYIRATVCLSLCGLSVVMWRVANAVDEEYYRGTK